MLHEGSGDLFVTEKTVEEVLYFLDEYYDEELARLFSEEYEDIDSSVQ